jgi:hypothetical protein
LYFSISFSNSRKTLNSGAARITVEAANEPAVNVESVVYTFLAVVERLLPWLKDDISSSESSNSRTPSPDIELVEIFEFEEAARRDPEPKQLNEIIEVEEAAQIVPESEQLYKTFGFEEAVRRDPDSEQLNEIIKVEEAAQIDPEQEKLNEIFKVEEAAQRDPEQE